MSSDPTTSNPSEDVQLRIRIDRSLRLPLLFFFTSAAVWLVFGTILGFISSITLNIPSLFGGYAIFSYGRIYPAHMNALVYGWGMQAGFGVALWIMARLSRTPLKSSTSIMVAGHIWNAVVMLGLIAILVGRGTSVLWQDFPSAFWPVILVAYLLITIWMLGMYATRKQESGYISQLYILASVLWFPWIYLTANALIYHYNGAAVAKTGVNAWFMSNMVYMVLTPTGLAVSYYIIPKIVGRPVHSYQLARIGFWTLVGFAGWTGISRYNGGPLPAWMPTVSSAAAIFLLIPAFAVLLNTLLTLKGKSDWVNYSPSLRFTVFGTIGFVVLVVFGVLMAVYPTSRTLQFTMAQSAYDLLATYGFFTMVMFGAIYFIVPRITGCEWRSAGAIRFHFWFSAYGILTIVAFMTFAGIAQGHILANWTQDFQVSVERSRPYLAALALGWFFIVVSNVIFLWQVGVMALRRGRTDKSGPTLIHKQPEAYFEQSRVAAEG